MAHEKMECSILSYDKGLDQFSLSVAAALQLLKVNVREY